MSSAREFAEQIRRTLSGAEENIGNWIFWLEKLIEQRDSEREKELKVPGPCGKHPKACLQQGPAQSYQPEDIGVEFCTVCAELARYKELQRLTDTVKFSGLQSTLAELQSKWDESVTELARYKAACETGKRLTKAVEAAWSTIEFYFKREIESPSNHQEFARQAEEKLDELRAALKAATEGR